MGLIITDVMTADVTGRYWVTELTLEEVLSTIADFEEFSSEVTSEDNAKFLTENLLVNVKANPKLTTPAKDDIRVCYFPSTSTFKRQSYAP
jgi:hypothetical protein